ncbi:MAG: NAD(P)H-dependent oxidoreductase subunit E [Planctomycetota bacterium]|nr:NAD(P)H-dependent oxidoreductase subunit E [Planctomycetota bacterium]MDA1210891.1 NAD(P)H-dependent oxidoreductase subunit E [Planctomycetota bacterium]
MGALSEEIRERIRAEFPKYPNKRAVTLNALHIVQDAQRQVSIEAMREIAELLELHPAEVHDTMSFYGFFRDEKAPLGKKRVWVCRSISCMLRGGEELLADVCHDLGVKPGETTADGEVTLEFAECLGVCEGAPCVLVNDECYPNMTAESTRELIKKP